MTRHFNHRVIDGFLTDSLRDRLLQYTLASESDFSPSMLYAKDESAAGALDANIRKSLHCKNGLGPLKPEFKEVVHAALPSLIPELGCTPFEIAGLELELTAHGNGSFFHPHIDIRTHSPKGSGSARMVTLVYYFSVQPQAFRGGEIVILPIGPGDPVVIEPQNNRLVAFASFVPHEVRTVICEPDEFSRSRFAINCWVHRKI